ncbi:MAG: phosphoribosylglycinamide formyltransferase [Geminicoccaceae bacterium]
MAQRLAVLASGGGSNLQALIDHFEGSDRGHIMTVIANEPGAGALERARIACIDTALIDHRDFSSRSAFDAALQNRLQANAIDWLCLAGFMRILTADFVERWRGRIVNIHPSLLPAFPGLHTHDQALRAGVRFSGCTVHFVTPALDAGPIIVQAVVPVMADDTADSLAQRVLVQEHRCYPAAMDMLLSGRARLEGDRVLFDQPPGTPDPLVWPI